MASNINPYNIDGTFPVAGQDNSSQGFRDNFTNIKNNFAFAAAEINDIQSKAILIAPLSGQTISNDMAGAQIVRPQLRAYTEAYADLGRPTNSNVDLNFLVANFQKVQPISDITLSISNWPQGTGTGATGYGVLRVWFIIENNPSTGIPYKVTLPGYVNIGVADIAGYNSGDHTIYFDVPGNYVFDFSSSDNGDNFLIFDITRNRSTFHDSNLFFNDSVTPTMFIGWGDGIGVVKAADSNQNTVSVRGSIVSGFVGDVSKANLTVGKVDGEPIAGYTLLSTRGNLTANTFTPVKNGDYLGYLNAVTYSGYQGVANTFQQVSSVAFFATGSNVTYGLGGNIGFFTSPDGEPTEHGVKQAVGIENDQSVVHFGNIIVSNVFVPTSSTSGGTTGQISYDSGNVYICLGPNNWKKAALTSF